MMKSVPPGSVARAPSEIPYRQRVIDQPRPGWFRMRLVKRGPWVPARIGQEFGLFFAEIDGKKAGAADSDPLRADGVMKIWHFGREISQAEYEAMLKRTDRPDPRKPLDLHKAPSVF